MAQLAQTIMMSALAVGNVAKPVLPSAPGNPSSILGFYVIFFTSSVAKNVHTIIFHLHYSHVGCLLVQ